jgi:hypothetical protein
MLGTLAAAAGIFIACSKDSKNNIRLNSPQFEVRKKVKSITSEAEGASSAESTISVFEPPASCSKVALSKKYDFGR